MPTDLARIERQAVVSDISKIAAFLQETLGQKLTAYLCGLNDSKMVGSWISKKSHPKKDIVAARLRESYKAASIIAQAYGKETAKAWFFGTNSRLAEQSPAYLLRHSTSIDDIQTLYPVALAFVRS